MKVLFKKIATSAMGKIYKLLMRRGMNREGRKPFDHTELKLVREALVSQNLFGMDGYMVSAFEREFAELYGVPYGIASTSGTAALHAALGALDLDAGDEVITAPVTDLGTIIPILYQNLIPVFAETDETFCMDSDDIEKKITSRTKAILVVHLFGNVCDMDRVMAVATKHGIPVIEDCSQTHLTRYKGKYAGTIGDIGCFSFQQSKHMTTGDGGMTITSNKAYADRMKLFVDKGYARKGWGARAYLFHAPNYRMNELTAAVGRAQLKKVKKVVGQRHAMGVEMSRLIQGLPGVTPVPATKGVDEHGYWLYPFYLTGTDVTAFCKKMIEKGVYAMPAYTGKAIYLCTESLTEKKTYGRSGLPFSWRKDKNFEYKEGLCPLAEKQLESLVCLPWNESWGSEGVKKAAEAVKSSLRSAAPSGGEAISAKGSGQIASSASKSTAPPRDDKRIKVAIIGCGQIGRAHLDAYKANAETVKIVALVDTDRARAEKFAKDTGAKVYISHQEMLHEAKPQAVSVCTLPSTHFTITMDLLDAGVHVLCEKPLGMSVEEAKKMLQKASSKNIVLLTAFKLRFFEEIQKTKDLLDKGSLGKLLTFRLLFGGYMDMAGTWHVKKELSGGGVIMDNGPHAADLIRYLFGDIASVTVDAADAQGLGVEDTAKLNFKLKKGATGTADLSWPAWVTPNAYLEVYGDEGSVLVDGAGITYKFKTWSDWKRVQNEGDANGGFARQIAHFIEAAKGRKPTTILPEAGLEAQQVIEAAYKGLTIEQRS